MTTITLEQTAEIREIASLHNMVCEKLGRPVSVGDFGEAIVKVLLVGSKYSRRNEKSTDLIYENERVEVKTRTTSNTGARTGKFFGRVNDLSVTHYSVEFRVGRVVVRRHDKSVVADNVTGRNQKWLVFEKGELVVEVDC
jgi:hypothetical protein